MQHRMSVGAVTASRWWAPNGWLVAALIVGLGCATPGSDWQDAQKRNTISAYRNFLTMYGDSEYAEAAQSALVQAEQDYEERSWENAQQERKTARSMGGKTLASAIETYERFLRNYPDSSQAPQAKAEVQELRQDLELWRSSVETLPAHSSQELEDMIYSTPQFATEIVPILEKKLIQEVADCGPSDRYFFNMSVDDSKDAGSVTLIGMNENVGVRLEFPEDRVPMGGFGSNLPRVPTGHGSIWRFSGTGVDMPDGYVITGRGDKTNRLTFGVIEGVGLVHLRGSGVVRDKLGREVEVARSNSHDATCTDE